MKIKVKDLKVGQYACHENGTIIIGIDRTNFRLHEGLAHVVNILNGAGGYDECSDCVVLARKAALMLAMAEQS